MARLHRIGEVAALTRVSVRTLHYYDQIGLLRPPAHSEGGQRLYAEQDLLRLQQILTLRYLGFPLRRIGELLDRADADLVASLRIQRAALGHRVTELQRIDTALGELLERRIASGSWAWDLVVSASAAVQDGLAQRGEEMDKTEELMKELGKQVTPEQIAAVERGWTALLADVRANRDLDPASPEAQALGERWNALREQTFPQSFARRQELMEGIAANYRTGKYAGIEGAPTPEDSAFIAKVFAARQGSAG